MVAIIGGERVISDHSSILYRDAGSDYGHSPDQLKVGMHSLGYVAETTQRAADDFFPGYARSFTDVGKERGWAPVTRVDFDAQRGPNGALMTGILTKVVRENYSPQQSAWRTVTGHFSNERIFIAS